MNSEYFLEQISILRNENEILRKKYASCKTYLKKVQNKKYQIELLLEEALEDNYKLRKFKREVVQFLNEETSRNNKVREKTSNNEQCNKNNIVQDYIENNE